MAVPPSAAQHTALAPGRETRHRCCVDVRLDHVAIAVPRGSEATNFLVGELGGSRYAAGPGVGFRFWQYRYAGGGLLELLEPDGPPGGFLQRFLERRGPGVHHVTFKVPEIRAATERATSAGYEVVGFNDVGDWKEAFLHPKQAQGIVVQLAQAPTEKMPEDARWPFPPEPAAAEPVALIGLRLAARDEERARRQWQTVLGGDCQTGAGGQLVFRWPESPLRIVVSLDAPGAEGPRSLEIASDRALAVPEGPHPVLGAAFTAVAPDD
jgi:catechol 2,3-dioxygenase-like lactoylglutathione lyase family enzyme